MYPRNKALKARIVYVDAATKAVRLSLKAHLVAYAPASALPPIGALYQARCSLALCS